MARKPVEYDSDMAKRCTMTDYRSQSDGRSTVTLECPFCGTEVEAYVWSLSEGGKKCPDCKALHTYGLTFPLKGSKPKEPTDE